MPQLAGSYFANSLTYLWKHSEDGALGIVINKPLQASVADIFDELDRWIPFNSNYLRLDLNNFLNVKF